MANHLWSTNNPIITKIKTLWHRRKVSKPFWITIGCIVTLLLFCILLIENPNPPKVQFVPEDIVYTHPISAVHGIDSSINSVTRKNTNTSAETYPQIVISEQFYDFGTVKTPRVVERVFVIANHGQAPLIIQSAYTTCGCTTADFTSSKIPPGKVTLMTVRFDSGVHDLRGTTVRRGVIIQTNDPSHPQQEIWLQATVQ